MNKLLFFWELPQNLLGLFLLKMYNPEKIIIDNITIYNAKGFRSAVSLGEYIIIDIHTFEVFRLDIKQVVHHEYGHQIQSRILGWLYLFLVGLPSGIRNIYFGITNKSQKWYYGHYPENWADSLGKVDRR